MPLTRVASYEDTERVTHHCSHACRHPAFGSLPFSALWISARCSTAAELAEAVGRSRKQIERWKRRGVPSSVADEVACALGLHVVNIWPEWESIA